MKINERVLKINGRRKIYLEKDLELNQNYKFEVSGTVNSTSDVSNEDETMDKIFNFDPILVEPKGKLGESMSKQDTRKHSQKFRGALTFTYDNNVCDTTELDFESYYAKFYQKMYKYIDNITREIIEENKL